MSSESERNRDWIYLVGERSTATVAHLQVTNDIDHDHRHVIQGCVIFILGDQSGKILCREFAVWGGFDCVRAGCHRRLLTSKPHLLGHEATSVRGRADIHREVWS